MIQNQKKVTVFHHKNMNKLAKAPSMVNVFLAYGRLMQTVCKLQNATKYHSLTVLFQELYQTSHSNDFPTDSTLTIAPSLREYLLYAPAKTYDSKVTHFSANSQIPPFATLL